MTLAVTHPWAETSLLATTSIATSTAAPVSGTNLLVQGVATSGTLSGTSDTQGNTYTILNFGSIGGLTLYLAYSVLATPLSGGVNVKITSTFAASCNASQSPLCGSGIATTNSLDPSSAVAATGSSASIASPSFTNQDANEILFGWMGLPTGATTSFTPGAGWTNQGTNTSGGSGHVPSNMMWQIVSAAAAQAATAAISPSGNWICGIVGFGDTPMGPPPPPTPGVQGMPMVQVGPAGCPC